MADLVGRHPERGAIDRLLARAAGGESGVLVLRGEAGIGKSALLAYAGSWATPRGFRVVAAGGMEAETQFAFAGLHQVCAPLLDRVGALAEPQRCALLVALGREGGPPPDRFLVGLATLNLLAEVAEEQPLLCLVDDAQWLDEASMQILAFVARRLAAERIVVLFGLRDPWSGDRHQFDGLADLRLDGLGDVDARGLLAAALKVPLDPVVRERTLAEARGNPLALQELPGTLAPAHLSGGYELADGPSVPRRIEESFRRRMRDLPDETSLLLLIAAAEPTGAAEVLWRAAEQLGIGPSAAAPAEAAGLLEIDSMVRFRHPLVRSAVYQAATAPDRRRVHRALSTVTDPDHDPDRRAWHRAQSVLGTDEDAAAELVRSADRARARGGRVAAAAFLRTAADLTPDPAARARRALAAAHATYEAGAAEAAADLITLAAAGPLEALPRARLSLLRAEIAFQLTRGAAAPAMLLEAARTLAPLDVELARDTFLSALDAAIITGGSVREVAAAARRAPPPASAPRPADLLLDGLATALTDGYEAAVPGLRRAVAEFRRATSPRWLWQAGRSALALYEDDLVHELAERNVRLARESGLLASLPAALLFHSVMLAFAGEFGRAAEVAAEEHEIARAIGAVPLPHARLILAAWRGDRDEAGRLWEDIRPRAKERPAGTEITLGHYAFAVLDNGRGAYEAAAAAAARACTSDELPHTSLALPELVEAATRAGDRRQASAALDQLDARTRASGTPWALGLAARSRALTRTGSAAETSYREAIERLGESRMRSYLARTHLVYGEWLRREGRRQDARAQLRAAHDQLSAMGADAFAARAAAELHATGEHPRKRGAQPSDVLTAHELHIARLVATGATSREVGAQLFLSPRTIEAHLRNIFRKLDISSRRQLRELRLP